MNVLRFPCVVVALFVLAGCSSPANFAGTYPNVDVTNDPDMCGFGPLVWNSGGMSSASANIMQAAGASAATMTITGAAAVAVGLLVGPTDLAGSVSGSTADFTVDGTAMHTSGTACTYTVDMHVEITLSGDTISGTATYTPRTNHDATCGLLNSCHNTQRILGMRTPTM